MVGLKYPTMAHLAGTQGKVELEAIVSSDGTVKKANALSGPPLLADWMKVALKDWRFSGCSPNAGTCRYKVTFVFEMMTGICNLPHCPND
jgi:outer membrane biosynthesis protein TonB